MPGISGVDLMRKARTHNPNILSILVTGKATVRDLMTVLNEGLAWKCIEKPWSPEAIADIARQANSHSTAAATPSSDSESKPTPKTRPVPRPAARGGVRQVIISKGTSTSIRFRKPAPPINKQAAKGKERKLRIMDKRYRQLTLIQEGGSGSVYKATDTLLNVPVAIKIIADRIAAHKHAMQSLFTEARIAMQLSHRNIVRLHNIQEAQGFYYLVMEYIQGKTLAEHLTATGSFHTETVTAIVTALTDALDYAHGQGIFHRDLNPRNVMLDHAGTLKIIDFGLACLAETFRHDENIVGTPYYMSPEEILGETPDQRTDVFSAGIMIHEFLCGTLPPHDSDKTLTNLLDYRPAPSNTLPEPVAEVLRKSFAKKRDDRWPTIRAFGEHCLAALCEGSP